MWCVDLLQAWGRWCANIGYLKSWERRERSILIPAFLLSQKSEFSRLIIVVSLCSSLGDSSLYWTVYRLSKSIRVLDGLFEVSCNTVVMLLRNSSCVRFTPIMWMPFVNWYSFCFDYQDMRAQGWLTPYSTIFTTCMITLFLLLRFWYISITNRLAGILWMVDKISVVLLQTMFKLLRGHWYFL